MSYIKKTATLSIFLMLVVTLGFLTGTTLLYQKSLVSLNDALQQSDDRVKEQATKIAGLQSSLESKESSMALQEKREANLTGLYSGLKLDNQALLMEKADLSAELNATKKDLSLVEKDLLNKKQELTLVKLDLSTITTERDLLIEELEDICDEAEDLNISECEPYS